MKSIQFFNFVLQLLYSEGQISVDRRGRYKRVTKDWKKLNVPTSSRTAKWSFIPNSSSRYKFWSTGVIWTSLNLGNLDLYPFVAELYS